MGKGPKTQEKHVNKQLPDYTEVDNEAVNQGGDMPTSGEQTNACLLAFHTELEVENNTHGLAVGSEFTVIPNSTDAQKLDMVNKGTVLGEYNGDNTGLMSQCIENGYIYKGTVNKTNSESGATIVSVTIKGKTANGNGQPPAA